jgi:hypothetical protein
MTSTDRCFESSMFSVRANPDCQAPFDYRHGRLFRFNKHHAAGEEPPNTHPVQHFWLCGTCCGVYTLSIEMNAGS